MADYRRRHSRSDRLGRLSDSNRVGHPHIRGAGLVVPPEEAANAGAPAVKGWMKKLAAWLLERAADEIGKPEKKPKAPRKPH